MSKIILYVIGVMLTVTGLFFCLLNLNLLVIGYSFGKYVKFIISNIECNVFLFGIIILVMVYERG